MHALCVNTVLYYSSTNSADSQEFLLVPFHAKSIDIKRKKAYFRHQEGKNQLQIAQVDRITLE